MKQSYYIFIKFKTFFKIVKLSESADRASNIFKSNSITSETEDSDFVLVDRNQFRDEQQHQSEHCLRPGHVWKKELIFRSKLTMHTSYDRKDNSEPASVTAVSISKDNKIVYVGDSRGRVYSWVCTENPGKTRADHWIRDDVVEKCKSCQVKFTFSERKHHCRNCGGIFCNNCSKYETDIPKLHIQKPVRVCQPCYALIMKTNEAINHNNLMTQNSNANN
jgi:hypothetical protein